MGSEYGPALDMFVDRSRVFQDARPRDALVIHKTAGFTSAIDCAHYFQTTPLEVSSHFIVGQAGEVVQCVSLQDGAAANCCTSSGHDTYWDQYGTINLNRITISIEHIDPSPDNSTPLTQAQQAASFALCLWLRDNYDMQWPDVKTHGSIDPVNRARCPGNYPMDLLIATMKGSDDVLPVIDQSKTLTGAKLQQAKDMWADPTTWASGICGVWQALFANNVNAGTPNGAEEKTVDWNGKPLVYREFAMGVRIEWQNGSGRAFTLTQEFQFT